MNKTHFEHAVYAVLMQLPFGLFGYWWLGAALAIGFFVGREHATLRFSTVLNTKDSHVAIDDIADALDDNPRNN